MMFFIYIYVLIFDIVYQNYKKINLILLQIKNNFKDIWNKITNTPFMTFL